jgi:hypothetical protein
VCVVVCVCVCVFVCVWCVCVNVCMAIGCLSNPEGAITFFYVTYLILS